MRAHIVKHVGTGTRVLKIAKKFGQNILLSLIRHAVVLYQ
ncbi:hypothetical protein FsymDg_1369 [Candidatus Protofrankia datiscae]|uniref:Uncharacterized protein n=1 Tax=Candidatus Protofrankia datiscae TaxID=2716812 RepID=F8B3D2_9ACTN|nr:hypothetical protein FsymDg_1369 [Candidatus Protofrankia datiscae]